MSVFKRPGAEFYSYDFRWRGRRFHGSTECRTKPEAKRFEADERDRAKAAAIDTAKPMSFGDVSSLYWQEVGQFRAKPKAFKSVLAWLQRNIGMSRPISAIDAALVAQLVAKKRGETRPVKRGKETKRVVVAAGTVNRGVVEPLRAILRRAADVWDQRVAKIDWGKAKLKEPQERVREASAAEEVEILSLIPADYQPAVRFAMLTGCRRAEIVGLRWTDVNFFSREFRVTGKGDRSRTIPMTKEVHDLLWELRTFHPTAVFTYEAKRNDHMGRRGDRRPITKAGFGNAWGRHVRGKVEDFRFHDMRHTAATRLVRSTGSIKLAQKLLGHAAITTTGRYAHVTHEDLRQGLEAVAEKNATRNATKTASGSAND